ncbi:MAG: hypothetical protein AAGU11_06870 [Syntrophobacteraceae bacterium]
MKRKKGLLFVLPGFFFLVLGAFLLTGCQSTSFYPAGVVAPEERIPLQAGGETGTWKSRELSVEYTYVRGTGQTDIAGAVYFADSMKLNFTILHDFRLSAIFLDDEGRVLDTQGIATDRNGFDPVPFRNRLAIPAGARSFAFSYQGTAIEGGGDGGSGGGITRFWHYPVR